MPINNVYYDLTRDFHFFSYMVIILLLFILISICLIAVDIRRLIAKSRGLMSVIGFPVLPVSLMVFLISFSILIFIQYKTFFSYLRFKNALLNNQCSVVTGVIEEFHPGGSERGNTLEHFRVNGVKFSYYPLTGEPGYSRTRAYGGGLDNGMRVKIFYKNKVILRIYIE